MPQTDPYVTGLIDFAESWATQPRDANGRWVKRLPGTRSLSGLAQAEFFVNPETDREARLDSLAGALGGGLTPDLDVASVKRRMPRLENLDRFKPDPRDPESQRIIAAATHEERKGLYEDHGLKSRFADIPDEDILAVIDQADDNLKAELMAEVERRRKVLELTAAAVERASRDAAREGQRKWLRRFDARLANIKGGQRVINLRERLLNDRRLDIAAKIRQGVSEHAFGYSTAVATALSIGLLTAPLGGVAAIGLLKSPPIAELLSIGAQYLGMRTLHRLGKGQGRRVAKSVVRNVQRQRARV